MAWLFSTQHLKIAKVAREFIKFMDIMNTTSETLSNGYKFFVLRRKLSVITEEYEDVFCVISDSTIPINLSNDIPKERHYSENIKKTSNLLLFRKYLMTFFNVNLDSNIFYMDENNKKYEVIQEFDLFQLWKLAKTYATQNRGVILLIELDNPISGVEKYALGFKLVSSRACQSDETIAELNKSNDRRYSRDIQDKDDIPPKWFVKYMEQLKKVIVKEVVDQVMANKMENLNMCFTRSPMNAQGGCIFTFNSCPRNHQNGTIESMQTIKNVKPGTVIKNDTINKSDSAPSDLAELQVCVTEHMYESNIPKENDCCTKYCPSKYQTDKFGFRTTICCCDEIENIKISSDIDNREGVSNEDNFEIIPEPSNDESSYDYISKKSILEKITPFFKKQKQNRNIKNCANVESPTKERLPLSSSIYIDENHFTACSKGTKGTEVPNLETKSSENTGKYKYISKKN